MSRSKSFSDLDKLYGEDEIPYNDFEQWYRGDLIKRKGEIINQITNLDPGDEMGFDMLCCQLGKVEWQLNMLEKLFTVPLFALYCYYLSEAGHREFYIKNNIMAMTLADAYNLKGKKDVGRRIVTYFNKFRNFEKRKYFLTAIDPRFEQALNYYPNALKLLLDDFHRIHS